MRFQVLKPVCWLLMLSILCLCGNLTAWAKQQTSFQQVSYTQQQRFNTLNGIVLLPYSPRTHLMIRKSDGEVVFKNVISNTQVFQMHLDPGYYEIRTDDDFRIITTDMVAYNAPSEQQTAARLSALAAKTATLYRDGQLRPAPNYLKNGKTGAKRPISMSSSAADGLTIIPVPRVSTSHYAEEPPSLTVDRHVVFSGVHTRLKAVIEGGYSPYNVTWDPGDGTGTTSFSTSDGYNSAVASHTYTGTIGALHDATITVTDAHNFTTTEHYYVILGDPASQGDRIARSSDEALWYLHTQLARANSVVTHNPYLNNGTGGNEPAVNEGWIDNRISSSAMYAICLENTGHSISGGVNFSNDPSKDAYVDDLNRLINYLTDYNTLQPIHQSSFSFNKTYTGIGTYTFDTHGPGVSGGGTDGSLYGNGTPVTAGNGIILVPSSYSVYDCGMHLQAISQAGYVDKAVPNRTEYPAYYDVIGDYVDGIQQAQGYSSWPEGGWRYSIGDAGYNDSDGSTAAWACIGLEAATQANTLTPNAPLTPIKIAPFVLTALANYWIPYDQVSSTTDSVSNNDYRKNPPGFAEHLYGGFGYNSPEYGTNPGKTGGGIVSLKVAGFADNSTRVLAAEGFLYRTFFAPDVTMGWNSARDAYGMYNILKGLTGASVTGSNSLLTDHFYDGTVHAGTDLDGFTLSPFDWFATFANFIAGKGASDLGHQAWSENNTLSQGNDGHYATTGTRSAAISPFIFGEWGPASSDSSAGTNLVTGWDLAVLVGTVFVPPPVAVINHPNAAANETTIPIQVAGNDYYARFDPGNSYELNPNATIVSAKWNFGDGSSVVSYTLPVPGTLGGTVPPNTATYSTGNVVTHHYTTKGSYTVTLTVTDDKGQTGTTSTQVTVTDSAVAPVGALTVQSLNTAQSTDNAGNVQIGIIDQGANIGKVTIQFDGSTSYDSSSAVLAPYNSRGISSFLWDWPVAAMNSPTADPATSPFNAGGTGTGTFAEGVADTTLNTGSKKGIQTYAFNFGTNPAKWPASIIVQLKLTSNFTTGALSTTISKQVILKPNSNLPTITPIVNNLSVHNITDTTCVVSFDTVDQFGNPVATNSSVNYGLTNAYGSSTTDGTLAIHHDVMLTGLAASTTYHYDVALTTTGGATNAPTDGTFTTLVSGIPNLAYSVQSHSRSGNVETVTFLVTNNGSGDAINFTAKSFVASTSVTVNGTPLTIGGAGTTITEGGGTYTFTVNYTLPSNFTKSAFAASFNTAFDNSSGISYTSAVSKIVNVP